jgi:AhpD family alkylhydroperoxidase
MAMVPLLTSDEFSEFDQGTIALAEKAYGQVLNTWAAIGNSPGLFSTYWPFLRHLTGPGPLDVRIKELTAVRVAVLNHCRYTTSHRCASARAKGVTTDELAAVADGDFDGFTEREALALRLTDAMTLSLPAQSWRENATGVPAQLREAAVRVFGPGELVELTMAVGLWNALSRFHRVMAFDLDMPEPPAEVDELL